MVIVDQRWDLVVGDCRDAMREMPDCSVDAVVTDPPYELGFMGKKWDSTGIAYDVEVWSQCLRVAKPGAHLLAFGGTRTFHRIACAIEDAGWEVRDSVAWIHGEGFPKGLNVGDAVAKIDPEAAKRWIGFNTALKPAFEPVVVARKPLDGSVAQNVIAHGCGALNIPESRIGDDVRFNEAAGNKPGGNSLVMSYFGMPQDVEGRECVGRWPANAIFDEAAILPIDRQYGASAFFYCAKPRADERGDGNTHATVKPLALMRYLIGLVTVEGQTVLDPFAGSGSTGVAALQMHRLAKLIELGADHADIIRARLSDWSPSLFDDVA